MSNYIVDAADLTSVANAIRTKGGTSAQLAFPTDFVLAIGNIPSGSLEWPFAVLGGSITPASDVQNLVISLDATSWKCIIASCGTTDYNGWPEREHTTEYEKVNANWFAYRFSRFWPCTWGGSDICGFYLDSNENGHSWKSNTVQTISSTELKVGYSGYKWKAGDTVHWILIGVRN